MVRLFGVFECCVGIGRDTLDLNWLLSELSETVLQGLYGKADWRSNLHSDLKDLKVGERRELNGEELNCLKAIGEDLWMIPSELEIQDCEENEYK